MCDYSLHLVASRPAKVGDVLVATDFESSVTRSRGLKAGAANILPDDGLIGLCYVS
jgi:hypothetical protein